jgi:hypothetical protein
MDKLGRSFSVIVLGMLFLGGAEGYWESGRLSIQDGRLVATLPAPETCEKRSSATHAAWRKEKRPADALGPPLTRSTM